MSMEKAMEWWNSLTEKEQKEEIYNLWDDMRY